MPKSKRAKVIHTSKVTKKGKELAIKTFTSIRECIDKYPYIFVFSVDNMRNSYLKDVRNRLGDSRLFFGKTKVMAKALGTDPETEHAPNTSLLATHLTGDIGLLFTPRSPTEVLSFFSQYHPLDYARAGTITPRAFTIPSGIVYSRAGEISSEEDVPISHTIEPLLRKLGVSTKLVKGKVELDGAHVVCKKGDILGARDTALLKIFGVCVAEFRVAFRAWWCKETEDVHSVEAGERMDVEEP